MSSVPNKYDEQQELFLGPPSSGYALKQGSGAFAPIIGDSLYWTEEGADPRWVNLTKLLGALFWTASPPYSLVVPGVTNTAVVAPSTVGKPICDLNADVTFQMSQPTTGRLESDDSFAWSCQVSFRVLWDNSGVTGHFMSFHIYKNAVDTGLSNGQSSGAGVADQETTFTGWVQVNPGDIIDVRCKNSTSNSTIRVYLFALDVVANRLKT